MLAAYFDDSGTHNDSKIVIWAGVIGTVLEFDKLDQLWSKQLLEPLPGKPKISKFSVGDCAGARGEFANYKPAERDALRYTMREIIRDSGVRPCAYSIPTELYNRLIKGRVRRAFGPPDGLAFAACADRALIIADANKLPLSCVFDKGQKRPWLDLLLSEANGRAEKRGVNISYGYASVESMCGLQAADTIATEHYWYSLECLKRNPPQITPHFQSLIDMTGPAGYVLLKPDIEEMRQEFIRQYPLRDWFRGRRGRWVAPGFPQ